jgi:hypothetical protein
LKNKKVLFLKENILSSCQFQNKKALFTVSIFPKVLLYMSSSFWLLRVESHDFFFQAEKERTACKAEQIHKMITIFTQNGPRLSF